MRGLAKRYLNIWVVPRVVNALGDPLLGYAQFPGGPAATDGVVILHSAFGTTGTAAGAFNKGQNHDPRGRTLAEPQTHLGRRRERAAPGSDLVADTPNQGGPKLRNADLPDH